jgi:acetamidase/formamidase
MSRTASADKPEYLYSVNVKTPPTMTVTSGEPFTIEVRGAFDDILDIKAVPTPFTPACEGHPLTPITGPIVVQGAMPGDAVLIDLLSLRPHGIGKSGILRNFGVLRKEFPEPLAIAAPIREGIALFGDRVPVKLNPNLGTVSTMPPDGYKPSYAGSHGGDLDQRDVSEGSRLHLPVLVKDALVFFGDPHAAVSDGILTGMGIECSMTVRTRITLIKNRKVDHPIIEQGGALHFVGSGPSIEAATEDCARAAVAFTARETSLSPEEAYMLLSVVGELRVGTSPRPIMATRLIVPCDVLRSAGWNGMIGGVAAPQKASRQQ